jgi:hypothetical protein
MLYRGMPDADDKNIASYIPMEIARDISWMIRGTRVYWYEDVDYRMIAVISALIEYVKCKYGYNFIVAAQAQTEVLILLVDSGVKRWVEEKGGWSLEHIISSELDKITNELLHDYWILNINELPDTYPVGMKCFFNSALFFKEK